MEDSALGFMALDDSILAGAFDDGGAWGSSASASSSRGYSSVPAACEARGSSGLVGLSNQYVLCSYVRACVCVCVCMCVQ
jgi:hypothetical protein